MAAFSRAWSYAKKEGDAKTQGVLKDLYDARKAAIEERAAIQAEGGAK